MCDHRAFTSPLDSLFSGGDRVFPGDPHAGLHLRQGGEAQVQGSDSALLQTRRHLSGEWRALLAGKSRRVLTKEYFVRAVGNGEPCLQVNPRECLGRSVAWRSEILACG